jgi:tryptophan-rich hypothetical protein
MTALKKINPKKLQNSKWTAINSIDKQKHWVIINVQYDEDQRVVECVIQAIINKQETNINWRDLNDSAMWKQGWQ